MAQGGTSSPSGAASNTPFAPQQQPNAGGGQQQPMQTADFGTLGGSGGNLGTAGTLGGQQQPMQTAAFGSGQGQMQLPNFAAPQQQPMQLPMQPFGGQQPMQQQQNPYGFDQRAVNADPQGFQQYMQQMQQREQQRPGSTMMGPPPPRQNPFQPQQPSFMQDPEYQGYQTQANDLQRQMQEYMQKAPMYQQLQDLQGKMAPFQQRYYQQQQDMQRMQQPLNQQRYDPIQAEQAYYERMASQRQQPMQQRQFNPYQQRMQQQQYQQPRGLQGLMSMLGGRGGMAQPQRKPYDQYESRRPYDTSRAMSMDVPQTYGHMEALPQNFMKNGGKV